MRASAKDKFCLGVRSGYEVGVGNFVEFNAASEGGYMWPSAIDAFNFFYFFCALVKLSVIMVPFTFNAKGCRFGVITGVMPILTIKALHHMRGAIIIHNIKRMV